MSNNTQLYKFYTKIIRETRGIGDNSALEYELRFGYKTGGKFSPMFSAEIKDKIFTTLGIDKNSLTIEESINSYYNGNIRKVAIQCSDGSSKDTIECKEVIKRIDWYMDSGLCLRFAVSHEKQIPVDINLDNPSVIRNKVREIYTIPGIDTEIHFTTVNMTGIKGNTITQEMEIEYKKIKDIDIKLIDKILNCFN